MDCLGKRDKTFDEYILREDTKQASYGAGATRKRQGKRIAQEFGLNHSDKDHFWHSNSSMELVD